jgi:hypothetical protein
MATISTTSSTSNPPDILLANIWAKLDLQPFAAIADVDQPHCPILAASEGFSRATAPATPQLYIDDPQPMFFPAGELFIELVAIDQSNPTYRAFFLPGNCSPLLSLCWPTDIGIDLQTFLANYGLHPVSSRSLVPGC